MMTLVSDVYSATLLSYGIRGGETIAAFFRLHWPLEVQYEQMLQPYPNQRM